MRSPGFVATSCPAISVRCVYIVCMARVNIYLPDELAAEARAAGLNVSGLTQDAIRRSLDARATDDWLSGLYDDPATAAVPHDAVIDAIDAERDAAPTRHG